MSKASPGIAQARDRTIVRRSRTRGTHGVCVHNVIERRLYQAENERKNDASLHFLEFVKDAATGLLKRKLDVPNGLEWWQTRAIRRELARRGEL